MGKKPLKDDSLPSGEDKQPVTDEQAAPANEAGDTTTGSPKARRTWMQAIREGDNDAAEKEIAAELESVIARHGLIQYEVLFLFDEDSIGTYHSDRLYSAGRTLQGKDILLVVDSPGGRIEPAYLISKTLKRIASNKFSVAVPRRAKSAATLISLGADEIHMGMVSQLGPIDPQVSGLPALALGNALNHIAEIAGKCPGASEMLTKYLIDQAPIRILGYYERVSESAAQYGERLLTGKQLPNGKTASEVAKHLVQHYKDHSFVIDVDEARDLLGPLIREQTPEYKLADEIYNFLDFVQFMVRINKKKFWIVGALPEGVSVRDAPDAN